MKSQRLTNILLLVIAVGVLALFFQVQAVRSPAFAALSVELPPAPSVQPQPGWSFGSTQVVFHVYMGDLPKDIRDALWQRLRGGK